MSLPHLLIISFSIHILTSHFLINFKPTMNPPLFIAAIVTALLLCAYSVYNSNALKLKFIHEFKYASPLIAAFIILSIITAIFYTNIYHNADNRIFLIGIVLGTTTASSIIIFIIRRYFLDSYETKIQELIKPMDRSIRDELKAGVDKFLNDKLFIIQKMSMPMMAKMLYTNRTYLSIYIHETYGVPFKIWIQSYRLEYAVDLLRSEPMNVTIKEIAHRSGFGTPSALSLAFKSKFGKTPTEWRKEFFSPQSEIAEVDLTSDFQIDSENKINNTNQP